MLDEVGQGGLPPADDAPPSRKLRISIFALSSGEPAGGPFVLYQYANQLARLGHEVHIGHLLYMDEPRVPLMENVSWFSFDSRVHHHYTALSLFPSRPEDVGLEAWESDVMLGQRTLFPAYGLPVEFRQGQSFRQTDDVLRACEGPIVCVSGDLVRECLDAGIPSQRVIHLANGLDHEIFRPYRGLGGRPSQVATLYNWVNWKRSRLAVEVLERVRQQVPELEAIAFGAADRPDWLPDWIRYIARADHYQLAHDVYSQSAAYLCAAEYEAFGLTSLEAMACGAALVTTDTGGSQEYAEHNRTALVSEPEDADSLVENLVEVLRNQELRVRIATGGMARAADFDWEKNAKVLEGLFIRYLEDPGLYLGGELN